MANMQPGTFKARIVNYTLSTNSKDNPQVEVLFEYTDGDGLSGTPHQIRWWGQLTEKSMSFTLKALATLGFKGKTDEDFAKLADGVEGGMLELGEEVDLVLEERTKEDGKKTINVKYINSPGSFAQGGFKNAMNRSQARVKLGAMNLAGQMALIRQEMGVQDKPKPKADKPAPSEPTRNSDDVPF